MRVGDTFDLWWDRMHGVSGVLTTWRRLSAAANRASVFPKRGGPETTKPSKRWNDKEDGAAHHHRQLSILFTTPRLPNAEGKMTTAEQNGQIKAHLRHKQSFRDTCRF
jgi:hypothetical protein